MISTDKQKCLQSFLIKFIKSRIILTPDLSSTKESLGGTQSSPQGSESKICLNLDLHT